MVFYVNLSTIEFLIIIESKSVQKEQERRKVGQTLNYDLFWFFFVYTLEKIVYELIAFCILYFNFIPQLFFRDWPYFLKNEAFWSIGRVRCCSNHRNTGLVHGLVQYWLRLGWDRQWLLYRRFIGKTAVVWQFFWNYLYVILLMKHKLCHIGYVKIISYIFTQYERRQ